MDSAIIKKIEKRSECAQKCAKYELLPRHSRTILGGNPDFTADPRQGHSGMTGGERLRGGVTDGAGLHQYRERNLLLRPAQLRVSVLLQVLKIQV